VGTTRGHHFFDEAVTMAQFSGRSPYGRCESDSEHPESLAQGSDNGSARGRARLETRMRHSRRLDATPFLLTEPVFSLD
jgi:hypothetical protein